MFIILNILNILLYNNIAKQYNNNIGCKYFISICGTCGGYLRQVAVRRFVEPAICAENMARLRCYACNRVTVLRCVCYMCVCAVDALAWQAKAAAGLIKVKENRYSGEMFLTEARRADCFQGV